MSAIDSKPSLVFRAMRRLLTPVSRRLCLSGPTPAISSGKSEAEVASKLLVQMIVVPGLEKLARRNAENVAPHCRLTIVLNGFGHRHAERIAPSFPADSVLRLRTLPRFPARHGTALTVLLRRAREDFAILDPDCSVSDPGLFQPPKFEAPELLAAPDHAHFYNLNPKTGDRFPRTHFLILNHRLIGQIMSTYRITAEKYLRAPDRVAASLAKIGYDDDNFPRAYLRHFDTLLLVIALGLHDGLEFRWLPATAKQIRHLKHG